MALWGRKILFIGAGNMGQAMIRGLLRKRRAQPGDVAACDTDRDKLAALAKELRIETFAEAAEAAPSCEIAVLAVKPQNFPELLPRLKGRFNPRQMVLSVAAGVRLETIEAALGEIPVVRAMPNTPGLLGKGISAYCLGRYAKSWHAVEAKGVLSCLGGVVKVEESLMDAVTALSGSGPAYVFLFMEALAAAGEKLGLDPRTSFRLASQTLKGASAMISRKVSPARLRAQVTSPGGTTEAALRVLEGEGFRDVVLRALTAARDRARELGA